MIQTDFISPKEFKKLIDVSYRTVWNWIKAGKIKSIRTATNRHIIPISELEKLKICKPIEIQKINVIYARVSSRDRIKDLDYQVNRIEEFSYKNGYIIDKVYKEIASGMNDNRKQLWKMIDDNPTHIIVENKDRLTRFGFNYLEKLLAKLNIYIIVIHKDKEDEKDLIKDMVSIITSFCCRLYGLRRGLNKMKKIKNELNDNS